MTDTRNAIREIMLRRQGASRMGQPVTDAVLVGTLEEAADLLDAALARVVRLEIILAVECGDTTQVRPGWRRENSLEWNGPGETWVYRSSPGRWVWASGGERGEAHTAYEAMEAADSAGVTS